MAYVPARGDVVWMNFDPQAGHEQGGRRPALVLSATVYNARVGLAVLCPITSRAKGYSFEVALPQGLPVAGVILADQIKNMDWTVRDTRFACTAPVAAVEDVIAKINALMRP